MKNFVLAVIAILSLQIMVGCSSSQKAGSGRIVIENSVKGDDLPKWVTNTKVSWEESDQHYFKSTYTVAGNQRINGCWDLAKLEMKESLLSELSQDIKGEISLARRHQRRLRPADY